MDNYTMTLSQTWDKTFKKSEKVKHFKVSIPTRFGTQLAADVYQPIEHDGPMIGVAVSGPFGAVKEQCSGLYAQCLAEMGFFAIAFDPSFTGESSGYPRYVASPDINTEDFQAAVDYLLTRKEVIPGQVCILGICGWGGIALNTAQIDTRIKATVAVTMYDMSRVAHHGYFDSATEEQIYENKKAMNDQRVRDFTSGSYARAGGVVDPLPEDAPWFVKDYYAYYKTNRGYHPRSLNSNEGWNVTSNLSFANAKMLNYLGQIRSAVMVVHGEKAHSRYMGEDAFKQLKGENKELVIVPDATHVDLYDNMEKIPLERIAEFLRKHAED